MILRFILWAFLAYFLYKLVFNFLLPVIRVSWQLKKQVREFQKANMQQQQNSAHNNTASASAAKQPARKAGDYIDFEEIKE